MLVRAILPVFSIKHGVNDHSLGAKNISCGCHGCSRDVPVQYYNSDPRVHRSGRRFRLVVATGEIRAGVHPLLTSQMPRRLLHGRSVHVHAWSVTAFSATAFSHQLFSLCRFRLTEGCCMAGKIKSTERGEGKEGPSEASFSPR